MSDERIERARQFRKTLFTGPRFVEFFNSLPNPCSSEDKEVALMAAYADAQSAAPVGFVSDVLHPGASCTLCGAAMAYKCLSCGSTPGLTSAVGSADPDTPEKCPTCCSNAPTIRRCKACWVKDVQKHTSAGGPECDDPWHSSAAQATKPPTKQEVIKGLVNRWNEDCDSWAEDLLEEAYDAGARVAAEAEQGSVGL